MTILLFPENALCRLREKFLHKIHTRDLIRLPVQALQGTCLRGEGKGQLVGIEGLIGPVEPLVQLAVFAVAQQGVTGVGELGADLVGAARDELAFDQG